jgi:hypothetical protein
MKPNFTDFNQWVQRVGEWRDTTSVIPALVHEQIMKGKLDPAKPKRGPISMMNDPLSIQFAMGYKDRKYSLTYDTLKRIPQQLSLIAAILQTRCNQVASFAEPFRISKSLGFQIVHKNPSRQTTKGEREFIQSLEKFIYNCGADDPNPHSHVKRDDFESFLKKLVRDSLMYDQCCFEVVPDRRGQPYEFIAVDASTIRMWNDGDYENASSVVRQTQNYLHSTGVAHPHLNAYKTMKVRNPELGQLPAYVQIWNGQPRNYYNADELAFGVRNPRTDIYIQGYGYSELEQLITIITAHLYAEEYNRRFFMQGSAPKGILNFKGDNLTPDQLENFKRQWRANVEGVENSWRTPILQSEQGLEWINLHPSNQEMEYGQWIEYLIKITCAVFLIDPAELNFDLHGGVQQTPLFESSQEWKLKASRDRGLKPLLRFLAKMINDNIVSKIDDNYMFMFIGLDELSEQEKHQLRQEELASYKTLREIRNSLDLPAIQDDGTQDMVLNPVYLQAKQIALQEAMQKQQQQAMGAAPGGGGAAPAPEGQAPQAQGAQPGQGPQYSDNFTKSLPQPKILEISLDDESWIDIYRSK